MSKLKFKHILLASLLLMLSLISVEVYAQNYGTLSSRIYQNGLVIKNANKMDLVKRESFKDKYLKDLGELNYKGFSSNQYKEIQKLANNTILGGSTNISNYDKLKKFYSFIVDNFYYYETPEKISTLKGRQDNPYYLLTEEYNNYNRVRARDHGYAAFFLALARTQGIPARIVGGYYNQDVREEYHDWGSDITSARVNHVWVQAYVNGSWANYDPVADSYKTYDDSTGTYDNKTSDGRVYYDSKIENLSKTHITFKTYSGISNFRYVAAGSERKTLLSFLNIKSNGSTNGKKINRNYNTSEPNSWFSTSDRSSKVDGNGHVTRLYMPSNKGLYGKLSINNFSKLEVISVTNNKLTNLKLTNNKSLKTVNVANNNISRVVVKGSKNITSINTTGNPSTYIEYNYRKSKKKVVLKAEKGGTISVYYHKSGSKNLHTLKATPKKGYIFDGWYKNGRKISEKKSKTFKKSKSFTYVARFIERKPKTYIKVSISKQKMWYYKNGKLKKSSSVVTGMRNEHDTPRGNFRVMGKARKIYLIGEDYRSFVNYWMPFYGGYGLHDATWRSYFGGDIYKYNGSHGCVNLPYSVAKYLYNHVPVGTLVKIV